MDSTSHGSPDGSVTPCRTSAHTTSFSMLYRLISLSPKHLHYDLMYFNPFYAGFHLKKTLLEQEVQAFKKCSSHIFRVSVYQANSEVLKVFSLNRVSEISVAKKFGICDNFVVM